MMIRIGMAALVMAAIFGGTVPDAAQADRDPTGGAHATVAWTCQGAVVTVKGGRVPLLWSAGPTATTKLLSPYGTQVFRSRFNLPLPADARVDIEWGMLDGTWRDLDARAITGSQTNPLACGQE